MTTPRGSSFPVGGVGGLEVGSVELHPVRLLRAAQGDRALEAAIVLLSDAGVLGRLHCCVTVDVEQNLAWLDWGAAVAAAERLGERERAVVRLAAVLAEDLGVVLAEERTRRSVELAVRHLRV